MYNLFKIRLETRVEIYDEQIESICHHHYSKLSSAVMELRRICELVMKLRQQVIDINNSIQYSGREVISATQEYKNVQKVRRNVNLAIEHLESCIPLFQNYLRVQVGYFVDRLENEPNFKLKGAANFKLKKNAVNFK